MYSALIQNEKFYKLPEDLSIGIKFDDGSAFIKYNAVEDSIAFSLGEPEGETNALIKVKESAKNIFKQFMKEENGKQVFDHVHFSAETFANAEKEIECKEEYGTQMYLVLGMLG